jgi:hypothetical protein
MSGCRSGPKDWTVAELDPGNGHSVYDNYLPLQQNAASRHFRHRSVRRAPETVSPISG